MTLPNSSRKWGNSKKRAQQFDKTGAARRVNTTPLWAQTGCPWRWPFLVKMSYVTSTITSTGTPPFHTEAYSQFIEKFKYFMTSPLLYGW